MIQTMTSNHALRADQVHATLGRHMLADGYDMVLDVDRSLGRRLWDARRGRPVLDMFSFFATAPVGLNHPKMADAAFREKLLRAALANPTNSDIYTIEFAEFVATFARVGIPSYLPYAFFNLLSPLISLVYGFTGFRIEHIEPPAETSGEPITEGSPS